jgi:hypothetical protein
VGQEHGEVGHLPQAREHDIRPGALSGAFSPLSELLRSMFLEQGSCSGARASSKTKAPSIP